MKKSLLAAFIATVLSSSAIAGDVGQGPVAPASPASASALPSSLPLPFASAT